MQTPVSKPYTADELKQLIGAGNAAENSAEMNNVFPDLLNHLVSGSSSGFFIITDYSRMKTLYVCDNAELITGYPAKMLMKGGSEFMFSLFHPDETEALRQIHQHIIAFFSELPPEDKLNYSYSYDIRLRKADCKYIRLQCHFECKEVDSNGHLLLGMETFTDITLFDTVPYMTLVISHRVKDSDINDLVYRFAITSNYLNLSKREREVSDLISLGYRSKEIAGILNISRHTVDTHRRKIKKK